MAERSKIAVVVVVYNIACSDSSTCRVLRTLQETNIRVLIYDNSTKNLGNREYCEEVGWTYLGGTGNVGLSVAYNTCITWLKMHGECSFVCLFDDDTLFDEGYFHALQQEIKNSSNKIFVPLIYSNKRLLSPARIKKSYRVIMFPTERKALEYKRDGITAINSGMALDLALFDNYRYDENIFLDGIDHKFLCDMANKSYRLHIFLYRCEQRFSGDSKPSIENALTRFQIFVNDYRYILKKKKFSYWYLVGKHALRLILQYRSLKFVLYLKKEK